MKKIPLWRTIRFGYRRRVLEEEIIAWAMVDDWRYDELRVWRWRLRDNLHGGLYAERMENGKHISMHEVVAGSKHPDHIDGNGLNNQEGNLRLANDSQNAMNRKKVRGSSRYKGVSKSEGGWTARIKINKKIEYLGVFQEEILAAGAYDKRAKELFGERALLNGVLP